MCFLDIETTGLKAGYHEITELGFIHEKLGSWCIRIAPRHMDRAQPEALTISRYNELDWDGAPRLSSIAGKVVSYLEDAILVGHNIIGFDMPMIRGNFEMLGLNTSDIDRRALIDTQVLALTHLVPQGLKGLSLKACCAFFDISNAGAHNAYDDAARCKAVYEKIMESLQWTGGDPQQEMF